MHTLSDSMYLSHSIIEPGIASYHRKPRSRDPRRRHVRLAIRGRNMCLWALNMARGAEEAPAGVSERGSNLEREEIAKEVARFT